MSEVGRGQVVVKDWKRRKVRRSFCKKLQQEKRCMDLAEEILLVDDGNSLMAMWLVIGTRLGVGVQTLVMTK